MTERERPYVLLIGLDGFRHDYAEAFGAANLLEFRTRASGAHRLIPRFPSSTFPNFYSMATGLEPEDHGIVGMHFYDPAQGREFDFRRDGRDGSWYGGVPLWSLAEQQGVRAASYFWVGTDASIGNFRPSYFYPYSSETTHSERIAQVVNWFALPEPDRPHLVTVYFSDVDTMGHFFGPDAPETRQAVAAVDETVGELIRRMSLVRPEVNVIIVSDHGMSAVERIVEVGRGLQFPGVRFINETSHVMLYGESDAAIDAAYRALASSPDGYAVYRRAELPAHLCFSNNPRAGDLVILPARPDIVYIRPRDQAAEPADSVWPKGWHGYDPLANPEMHGIFYAAGPDIGPGRMVDSIANTAVFSFTALLLGLETPHLPYGSIARSLLSASGDRNPRNS